MKEVVWCLTSLEHFVDFVIFIISIVYQFVLKVKDHQDSNPDPGFADAVARSLYRAIAL